MNNIAYGTYRLRGQKCYDVVKFAIQNGYRTIDTAELYKNHEYVGKAIRDCISEGVVKRNDLTIISKIHNEHQRNGTIKESCQQIINELNIGYVDIILLHTPHKKYYIDSYDQLNEFYKNNKQFVKHIGVSNFDIEHLNKLSSKPYMNQIELSMFNQRKNLVKYCNDQNIIVQAHSCLTNKKKCNNQKLIDYSVQNKIPVHEIMIRWCLNKKICVVIGSQNYDNILKNIKIDVDGQLNFEWDDEHFFIYKSFDW